MVEEGTPPPASDLYTKCGFRDSPFSVVATPEGALVWADRAESRRQMDRLLVEISRLSSSRVYTVWGWWGAGKTHWLLTLLARAKQSRPPPLTSYAEIPQSCSDFLTCYQAIARGMLPEMPFLHELFLDALTTKFAGSEPRFRSETCPSMPSFLVAMKYLGSAQQDLVDAGIEWFSGRKQDPESKRRLTQRGLQPLIDNDERAIAMLEALTQMVGATTKARGVLVLLDEFQRFGQSRNLAKREALQNALVHMFNRSRKIILVMAYAGRDQGMIQGLVSPALLSRKGATEPVEIGVLSSEDALVFVKDLFGAYRLPGAQVPNIYYPFIEESVRRVVQFMNDQDPPWLLKPRNLITLLDRLLNGNEEIVTSHNGWIGPEAVEQTLVHIRDNEPATSKLLSQEE